MAKILFQLTPEIIDMIIFGMENQSEEYMVNIKTGDIISEAEAYGDSDDEDIESSLISVPDWLPADGFQLMESFVASLHNPVHMESLRKALSSGKGSFRNFKSAIKGDDVLTDQWYDFKEKAMRSRVIEWYNLNSEVLKYQDINENTDETEDLLQSDFIFSIGCSKWGNIIESRTSEAIMESLEDEDPVIVDYMLSRNSLMLAPEENNPVIICAETLNGEFSGFIAGIMLNTDRSGALVSVVNTIWVEKNYRGLGLARHLIDEFSKYSKRKKAVRLLFELPSRNLALNSTLEARGASLFSTTMVVNAGSL